MIIGLTGTIGSGKSTISRRLVELGAEIIDADQVARDVVGPGTTWLSNIVKEFGAGVLDAKGELDRAKLSSIVFSNPQARDKLEAITHPEISRAITERIDEYRAGLGKEPALVVEVPLLIESGMQKVMDETWVVISDRESQIKRVMTRSNLSRKDVLKRINVQMSQEEKCMYADRVIDNSGPIEATIKQVDDIWTELTDRMIDQKQKR